MSKRLLLTLFSAATLAGAAARINSPLPGGYMARSAEMYRQHNYNGCIDQLSQVSRDALTDEERCSADWLMAEARFALDGAAAKPHYLAFLAAWPYSLHRQEALMRIGDCLFESDYAGALRAYGLVERSALPADRAEELDYRMGYCLLKLGDYDKALPLFNSLTRTKTYGAAARFYCAYIAYAHGDYTMAERLFKQCDTSAAPGDMADYYLAQIYFIDGDYRRTVSTVRTLLRRSTVKPQFAAEANRLAGESLYQLGDASAAIPYLKKYIAATDSPELSTLYILGISQYNQGEYRDAVNSFTPVAAVADAMGQSASLYIGQALMKLGDNAAALLAFDKALRMDFDAGVKEAACYNYAVAKFSGGNIPFVSSVAVFEDFLRQYPDSRYAPEVQQYIVDGYMTDRDYDRALQSIERMKNPSPRVLAAKQKVLYNLGASALVAGNPTTALVHLTEADRLAAHDAAVAAEVKLLIGEAAYRTGDYGRSRAALDAFIAKAKRNNPNLPLARYDLGYTDFAQKRYTEAAASFGKVADAPGSLPAAVVADTYNRLGDISYYASDFAKARGFYDRAYATDPSAGDYALFQTAMMKGFARDHKGKIADLDRLAQEFPGSSLLADAMLETSASYIQLRDNASAIATYRRLVDSYPNTAQGRQGYLEMAITLLNAGKRGEAVSAYRDIISLYPTSGEAAEAAVQFKRLAAEDGTLDQYMAFVNSVPGAPGIDVAEVEQLSFEAAEKEWLTSGSTARLRSYAEAYPTGAYTARALSTLLEDARLKGDAALTAEYAAALVGRFPDNGLSEPAYVITATQLYDDGETEAALEAWQALRTRASSAQNLAAANAGIMRAARDLGDYAAVASAADAILASSAGGSEYKNEAVFSKGLALSASGKREEARGLWQSISGITDDLYGAKSAYFLAQSLYDDNQADKALEAVEALNNSGTPHSYWLARGFILLSDIYASQGKEFEAREYLNALRDNYPGSESDIFMMIQSRLNK